MATFLNPSETTLVLNGQVITDFAQGDNIAVTFPNDLHTITYGRGGNATIKKREDGSQGGIVLTLLKYSNDARFFNNAALNSEVMSGSIKAPYRNTDGSDALINYVIDGAVVKKNPDDTMNDTDGNDTIQIELIIANLEKAM